MNKMIIGFLTIIILATGIIYISLNQDARIRIDEDKSTFYVFENGKCINTQEGNKLCSSGWEKVEITEDTPEINQSISQNIPVYQKSYCDAKCCYEDEAKTKIIKGTCKEI